MTGSTSLDYNSHIIIQFNEIELQTMGSENCCAKENKQQPEFITGKNITNPANSLNQAARHDEADAKKQNKQQSTNKSVPTDMLQINGILQTNHVNKKSIQTNPTIVTQPKKVQSHGQDMLRLQGILTTLDPSKRIPQAASNISQSNDRSSKDPNMLKVQGTLQTLDPTKNNNKNSRQRPPSSHMTQNLLEIEGPLRSIV